ncbi:MAG: phage antirepressor N-terminal domain-containing protein [Chloroflexota bacterium]
MKPIDQKQIEFQERNITAVMVQDSNNREQIYIPLRPLIEGMGLDWSGQYKRIQNHPVLSDICVSVGVTPTQTGQGQGAKEMLCIPISYLNGFLFGINANRVKAALRPLIIEYQAKCYEVLFNAFNGTESMIRFYQAVGYDEKWIGARIEKHKTGSDLNDVWLLHGVPVEDHEKLQDIINKGTFGVTVAEHKQFKRIPEEASLQDNMTRPELLISALADEAATENIKNQKPDTMAHHEEIAKSAGEYGQAVADLYKKQTGKQVLSNQNHLDKGKPSLPDSDQT